MDYEILDDWTAEGRDPGLVHDGRLRSLQTCGVHIVDREAMVIDFRITTGVRDRMGDTLNPKGWQVAAYRKNPVFLWAHNYEHPPIGKSLKVARDSEPAASGGSLVARTQFADTETKGSFLGGKDAFALYDGGFLHAVSVGFIPLERPARVTEKDEDGNDRFVGFDFPKNELLEHSAVPVPANPEALALGLKSGKILPNVVLALHGIAFKDLTRGEKDQTRENVCRACDERTKKDADDRAALLLDGLVTRIEEANMAQALDAILRRLT